VTADWPRLPVDWEPTRATLHLWTQIIGKVRLALAPPQNHFWHSTLYVSTHGLTTSPMPYGSDLLQIDFDFLQHQLLIDTSRGERRSIVLEPKSVADFYAEVMAGLHGLGVDVSIYARPVELPDPIPFAEDRVHAAYDPAAVHTLWRALIQVDRVFKHFRGKFLGKSSPSHFFWGAFDLAVTRFSGRRAPQWSGPVVNVHPHVMHASYSHEVSSAGFWVGGGAPPLFYSYAVPEPAGFRDVRVRPPEAVYSSQMGEFVLPYEAVRAAEDPDETLRTFLETTYAAAADRGGWDRALLEEPPPCTCDLSAHPELAIP
jgi:hypothetical protein